MIAERLEFRTFSSKQDQAQSACQPEKAMPSSLLLLMMIHCKEIWQKVAWAPGKRAVVVTAESDHAAAQNGPVPTQNGDVPHANGNEGLIVCQLCCQVQGDLPHASVWGDLYHFIAPLFINPFLEPESMHALLASIDVREVAEDSPVRMFFLLGGRVGRIPRTAGTGNDVPGHASTEQ
eukprot:1160410-Pelagomonas_calceolata.AAC.8